MTKEQIKITETSLVARYLALKAEQEKIKHDLDNLSKEKQKAFETVMQKEIEELSKEEAVEKLRLAIEEMNSAEPKTPTEALIMGLLTSVAKSVLEKVEIEQKIQKAHKTIKAKFLSEEPFIVEEVELKRPTLLEQFDKMAEQDV